MCGIFGFSEIKQNRLSEDFIRQTTKVLRHRGPDDSGYVYRPGFGLLHTRLSIIDLSPGARQPMKRGRYTITYNGEIFNYRELRDELKKSGHVFHTDSDTEVVLVAYEEWKESSFLKLNGMFAFAIYDEMQDRWIVVRDRLGIKPVFFVKTSSAFIFASEVKAFFNCPYFEKKLSPAGLRDYLTLGYSTGPGTIWSNCFRLLPGHYMSVNCKTLEMQFANYWSVNFQYQKGGADIESTELREVVISEFHKSVVSDVPIGVCLSGGVDSNVLTAILAKEAGIKLKTYSLSSQDASYDENAPANQVADFLKTEHRSLQIAYDDRSLGEMIDFYGEPISDQNTLSFRAIARQARLDGVKVLLTGLGGDELFLGYPNTLRRAFVSNLFRMPQRMRVALRKEWFGHCNRLYKAIHILNQESYRSAARALTGNCLFDDEVQNLLLDELKTDLQTSYFDQILSEPHLNRSKALDEIMLSDLRSYLPDNSLRIADLSGMAESVEIRVPYLANRVVELALQMKPEFKYRSGVLKFPLRQIEQTYLPKTLTSERKKNFFPFIKGKWIKQYLQKEKAHFLSPAYLKKQGIFNHKEIQKLLNIASYSNVKIDNKIWNLLVFQIWHSRHF